MSHEPEADVVVEATHHLAVATFGDRWQATLTIGSLAHGGFAPLVSDVDVAVIVADPIEPDDADRADAITAEIRARGGLAERLSLFWATPSSLADGSDGGRFPALDRLDLARHGHVVHGAFDTATVAIPAVEQLIVEAVEFALVKFTTPDVIAELRDPAPIAAAGNRHATKRVLFPVRFVYTAATGEIGTNEAAVAWYLDTVHPSHDLVRAAYRWRTEPIEEAAAAPLLSAHLLPIYLAFIDSHIPLAESLDRPDLAVDLAAWRTAITT